jgi:hypothetical protein
MPTGNRRIQYEEEETGNISSGESKRVMAPHIDTCNHAEAISPTFDPNRALLRRILFIGTDTTKCFNWLLPYQIYQPMVELGAPDKAPLLLTERHVRLMAEHLSAQCDALCNNEYYICKDEDFRMNTAVGYRVARVSLGRQFISFKLNDLTYLSYIFFMVHNQLTCYTEAQNDVMTYVTLALYSNTFVEPSPTASKAILYYQLFEELKSIV